MEEQLAELFTSIYSNPNDEERQQAEAQILQLATTEEFFPSIFSLLSKRPTPTIQKESLIVLQKMLGNKELQIPLEVKSFCLQSLIQVVPSLSLETIRTAEKTFDYFVSEFDKNTALEDFIEIANFPSLLQDSNLFLAISMISKSVCKLFKTKSSKYPEFFSHFVTNIFASITDLLQNPDLNIKQMIYHSASRLYYITQII